MENARESVHVHFTCKGPEVPLFLYNLCLAMFSYVGANVWNEIENGIRNVGCTELFVLKMRAYLMRQSIKIDIELNDPVNMTW